MILFQLQREKGPKKKYRQKYRKAWEKDSSFKGWLEPVSKKPDKAYCKVCKRELAAVVTALRKHKDTAYHKENVSSLVDPTLCRIDSMLVDRSIEGSVRDSEMRMAGFLSEHNLSFNLMDHFSDLLPKLCPDSKIAAQFKSNVQNKVHCQECIITSFSPRTCAEFNEYTLLCNH